MLDPRNVFNGLMGIVAAPEVIEGKQSKIVKLRTAIDYAANAQDDQTSGYFDVTFYANDNNPNSKFVLSQIEQGNFKPGTKILVLGRLVQDRWVTDGKNMSKVVIVAESLAYGGNNPSASAEKTSGDAPLPQSF